MTAALIIAAGRTAKKAEFAPQQKVGTISAIQRAVTVFQRAGIRRIAVVCADSRTEKLVVRQNLVFLRSAEGAQMFDCVKAGLQYLQDKCNAVLITPVDIALFSVQTVQKLLQMPEALCVPAYQGKNGHPILLRGVYFDQICAYTGSGGLAGAIRAASLHKTVLEVSDAGILADVQRDDTEQVLPGTAELQQIYPELQIHLCKEQRFYGPEANQLLQLICEMGSLLEACRRIGISYSKGRQLIATMEQQLGYPVLERQQGGASGGSSVVTKKGLLLMQRYGAYCEAAQAASSALFETYFGDLTE